MSASASADGATTRALQETEIDAAHYGGPCRFGKSRCGSKLATTRKRPFSQYGQRANSMCVTRFMNLATDSITAACGGGTSSRDKTSGSRLGSQTAGKKSCAAPRKRGHSKNGRGDAPQIVVGMAVTRDGFPVRHWVFPGNTVDVTTVAKVKEDLRGWQLTRCLFVGDAGMVSQANLQTLSKGGGKYLLAMPMRRGDEVTEEVLSRPGRYRTVAENLDVKEVVVGEGERRRRYAVCFNPLEAKRQKAHREELLNELAAELASLSDLAKASHTKRVCALRTSARYGRLLKETKAGLTIDR